MSGHISAEPALATGITLMSLALRTSLALVEVKADLSETLQCVLSHVRDCTVTMAPIQTKVHSDDWIYLSYRSRER